jgi:hypothetical protein
VYAQSVHVSAFFWQYNTCMMFSIGLNMFTWPFRCWTNLYELLLYLNARHFFFILEIFLLFCPTYTFPQSEKVSFYTPLARNLLVVRVFGFKFSLIELFVR